ncbi:hypothetical protein D3C77_348020 [compost metagenome]
MDVVRGNELDRAGALADGNGDLLTVCQGDDQGRTGNGCAHRSGVGHHAAFSDARGGRQGNGRSVEGVGDFGYRGFFAHHQVFKVAAIGLVDGYANIACIDVHVIARRRHADAAFGLAGGDGDHRAVAQGDGHRGAGRVGQGSGVDDLAAFGDGAGSGEAQAGIVDRVGDGGNGRVRVRHQVFKVAARGAGDGGADAAAVVVDVVRWRLYIDGAGGLARADGDGGAVGQGDGHRRLCRVGQGGGVGDHATFGDTRVCGQGDRGGVDGVGDLGDRRGSVRGDDQATATGGAGNGRGDLAAIQVHGVVRRDGHADAAGGLAGADDDDLAIGQGHGQVGQRRLAQGGGVDDHAAGFGD